VKVEVYRNLKHGKHARPLYSIRYNGKVIARRHRVLLANATFHVSEAGRQRVLREKRKHVHAWVRGWLVGAKGCFGIDANDLNGLPMRVTYDPYKGPHFTAEGHHVIGARAVLLNERGMSAAYLES
jgi:hypothetical protein